MRLVLELRFWLCWSSRRFFYFGSTHVFSRSGLEVFMEVANVVKGIFRI